VVNGTRATITRIRASDRAVEAVDDRGVRRRLPADYLDAGHVTHGYAITGHKAQGLTCDHTYTLGSETLYREWGYVAMSRGRLSNQLYHGPTRNDDDGLHHHVHLDDNETAALPGRLRRSRAEMPVTPELVEIAAAWQEIDAQIGEIDFGRRVELLRYRDPLEHERKSLADHIERLRRRLEQEGSGFPRRKQRKLVEELNAELEQSVTRLAMVEERLAEVRAAMQGIPDNRELQDMYDRRDELDGQLRGEADARVRGFRTAPPSYLINELGPPPTDCWRRERWEAMAAKIEHHRLRWAITDPTDALGDRARGDRNRRASELLRDEIRRTCDELLRDRAPQRALRRAR